MADTNDVERAHQYAASAHAAVNQRRQNGDPYIVHPERVMKQVQRFSQEPALLQAALLHDTLEDTQVTFEDLKREFGDRVAMLVHWLTNDETKIRTVGKSEYLAEKLSNPNFPADALLVKLCDRLDNISDISTSTKPGFAERYSKETFLIMDRIEAKRSDLTDAHRQVMRDIRACLQEQKLVPPNP
jgi:(p)ppGpp synthase/HD superfamily hydrolase